MSSESIDTELSDIIIHSQVHQSVMSDLFNIVPSLDENFEFFSKFLQQSKSTTLGNQKFVIDTQNQSIRYLEKSRIPWWYGKNKLIQEIIELDHLMHPQHLFLDLHSFSQLNIISETNSQINNEAILTSELCKMLLIYIFISISFGDDIFTSIENTQFTLPESQMNSAIKTQYKENPVNNKIEIDNLILQQIRFKVINENDENCTQEMRIKDYLHEYERVQRKQKARNAALQLLMNNDYTKIRDYKENNSQDQTQNSVIHKPNIIHLPTKSYEIQSYSDKDEEEYDFSINPIKLSLDDNSDQFDNGIENGIDNKKQINKKILIEEINDENEEEKKSSIEEVTEQLIEQHTMNCIELNIDKNIQQEQENKKLSIQEIIHYFPVILQKLNIYHQSDINSVSNRCFIELKELLRLRENDCNSINNVYSQSAQNIQKALNELYWLMDIDEQNKEISFIKEKIRRNINFSSIQNINLQQIDKFKKQNKENQQIKKYIRLPTYSLIGNKKEEYEASKSELISFAYSDVEQFNIINEARIENKDRKIINNQKQLQEQNMNEKMNDLKRTIEYVNRIVQLMIYEKGQQIETQNKIDLQNKEERQEKTIDGNIEHKSAQQEIRTFGIVCIHMITELNKHLNQEQLNTE